MGAPSVRRPVRRVERIPQRCGLFVQRRLANDHSRSRWNLGALRNGRMADRLLGRRIAIAGAFLAIRLLGVVLESRRPAVAILSA